MLNIRIKYTSFVFCYKSICYQDKFDKSRINIRKERRLYSVNNLRNC